jgi:hypothetical protein
MTGPDPRLVGYLREQVQFLRLSGASYDSGFEGEARRLATTIRVLVHDTATSHSLLAQLGIKDRIRWTDTSIFPSRYVQMADHGGLALAMFNGSQWAYKPFLDVLAPNRVNKPVVFEVWWEREIVVRDGESLTRRRFVLNAANKTGGAHVDPKLDAAYEEMLTEGLWASTEFSTPAADMGDIALANVRQIAWETEQTLTRELGHLLEDNALGRNKPLPDLLMREADPDQPCPCGSGRMFGRCHG